MGSRRVLGSSKGSKTAGLEPDFGTGRQWRPLDQALEVLWQAGAWPSAHRCSTGKARAPPPRPPPPASATSTTPPEAQGCCCSCANNASRMAAPAPPPNRSCAWGLPPMRATRVSARWRFAGGWSGRSRRRGCQAVAWHSGGVGGLRGAGQQAKWDGA